MGCLKIGDEFEVLLCDEYGETGLLKLPGFLETKVFMGVKYRLCERKNGLKSFFKKEYCACSGKYLLSSPFAKYDMEHIKKALALARLLGVKESVKVFFPVKPAPLIILLPNSFFLGVLIKCMNR